MICTFYFPTFANAEFNLLIANRCFLFVTWKNLNLEQKKCSINVFVIFKPWINCNTFMYLILSLLRKSLLYRLHSLQISFLMFLMDSVYYKSIHYKKFYLLWFLLNLYVISFLFKPLWLGFHIISIILIFVSHLNKISLIWSIILLFFNRFWTNNWC